MLARILKVSCLVKIMSCSKIVCFIFIYYKVFLTPSSKLRRRALNIYDIFYKFDHKKVYKFRTMESKCKNCITIFTLRKH